MAVAPGGTGRVANASTMTRAQILARGAGTRARPPAAPQDPYDSIIAGLPQPQTSTQIGQTAQGEISPLLAALTGTVNSQAQNAEHAISGYSNDAASKLSGIDWGAPYRSAESGQAAIDAALQQSLTGAGSSDASALASRLGVIKDPSVAAAAGGLAGNGAAAGTTALANGSANLGSLLSNAASADSYGQKQPELTRLAAEQQIATAGAQAQQTIAADAANLEQQLPSIISNLTSRSDSAASTIASARENQLSRQDAIAAGGAKNALTQQANQIKVDTVNANNQTKLQIAQMNQAGKVTSEQMTQARSDRTYRLQFTKVNGYDPVTGKVAPGFKQQGGQIVKVGTTKAGGPGAGGNPWPDLSKSEVLHLRGGMKTMHDGIPAVPATTTTAAVPAHPPLTYRQAIQRSIKNGYSQADATSMANRIYAPGELGRPGGKPPYTFDPHPPLAGISG